MYVVGLREKRSRVLPERDFPPIGVSEPAIRALPPEEAAAVRAAFSTRRRKAAQQTLAAIKALRTAVPYLEESRTEIRAAGAGLVRKTPRLPDKEALVALEIAARAIAADPAE